MKIRVLFWLCAAGMLSAQSLSLVSLPDLTFIHRHSPTTQKYLLETMGGGVALLDYNNDGRLDVFLVNGGKLNDPAAIPVDYARKDPLYWNRLFRQNADGSFTDVTEQAGISHSPNSYGMGAAVGDYDNDGFADLYVTGYPSNVLYRNNGNGTFSDVTGKAGAAAEGWSASAGFFDYDNDGLLDLFVTRYLDWDIRRNPICGTPFNAYCRPDRFGPVSNVLLHNEGGGRFRDTSAATGITASKGKALGVAFHDYDDDGFADIFVANDGMEQFLFHNEKGTKFREVAMDAGVAFADDGKSFAGMGVSFVDYDNDGRADILVTTLALEKYALFRNDGAGQFRYSSLTSGLAAATASHSGWGVALEDFDNDGWRDVFAAQSHVLDNVAKLHSGLHYLEPPALYKNVAGRFQASSLEAPAVAGRGAAFGDLNNDGAMDVVMSVLGGAPMVFRGTPQNHWLTIQLRGSKSNWDGLGAKIHVGKQLAYATTSGSYLSASDRRVHFGLGALPSSKKDIVVEIVWPSGKKQVLEHVVPDQILHVSEPE